jgi:hypothetical protein
MGLSYFVTTFLLLGTAVIGLANGATPAATQHGPDALWLRVLAGGSALLLLALTVGGSRSVLSSPVMRR